MGYYYVYDDTFYGGNSLSSLATTASTFLNKNSTGNSNSDITDTLDLTSLILSNGRKMTKEEHLNEIDRALQNKLINQYFHIYADLEENLYKLLKKSTKKISIKELNQYLNVDYKSGKLSEHDFAELFINFLRKMTLKFAPMITFTTKYADTIEEIELTFPEKHDALTQYIPAIMEAILETIHQTKSASHGIEFLESIGKDFQSIENWFYNDLLVHINDIYFPEYNEALKNIKQYINDFYNLNAVKNISSLTIKF